MMSNITHCAQIRHGQGWPFLQLRHEAEPTMSKISIGLRVLLSVAFIGAGLSKLIGLEMMVAVYDTIGVGQWFRYVTGLIEVGSVVVLWVPGRQVLGAALLACTMVGAILAHLLILGPSPLPAVVLGIISATVVYLHRDQITQIRSRVGV
jgi:hypothetical protein